MIVFMGVAGSGKSVQGKLLADDLGCTWFSTGEFLRQNINGKRRQEMLEGKLLGDDEIIAMIQKAFEEMAPQESFILDGFPRTLPQAKWLIAEHEQGKVHIDAIIHLQASRELVKSRLLSRGRQDDTEEAINKRFEEYESLTLPIVGWFKDEKIPVYEINGEQEIEQVHQEIMNSLKK